MKARRKLFLAALLASVMSLGGPGLAAETKPEGEMRFALYVTVAPAWLDPGEAVPGNLTPFWVLYALHDALVKPMPGQPHGAEPRGILDGERGSARLRIHLAQGPEIPQRRPVHRRGRGVQLQAREGGAAAGKGEGGRDRRPAQGAVRPA